MSNPEGPHRTEIDLEDTAARMRQAEQRAEELERKQQLFIDAADSAENMERDALARKIAAEQHAERAEAERDLAIEQRDISTDRANAHMNDLFAADAQCDRYREALERLRELAPDDAQPAFWQTLDAALTREDE